MREIIKKEKRINIVRNKRKKEKEKSNYKSKIIIKKIDI